MFVRLSGPMFQSQEQIEEERERVNTSMFTLEQELDDCRDQEEQWKNQLDASTRDLQTTREELVFKGFSKLHESIVSLLYT